MAQSFAFFDIDGTLITANVWRYFLDGPELAHKKRSVYLSAMPMYAARKLGLVGEPRLRERWVEMMARLLAGWQRAQIDTLMDRIVLEQMRDSFREDVAARAREHIQRGDRVVLVSGMFAGFAERFAKLLGAEMGVGTRLAFDGDICTGRIDGHGCAGQEKPRFMRDYAGAEAVAVAYAYADSFSDVPMLSTVAHPVVTYPDARLMAVAQAHGWEVIGTAHD
ncbi:MAG: HAD-IB family hydrolase [Anaerolineae bacterium]|nr:HAD-IB family hydrolase [Anaerolineae bacterium]